MWGKHFSSLRKLVHFHEKDFSLLGSRFIAQGNNTEESKFLLSWNLFCLRKGTFASTPANLRKTKKGKKEKSNQKKEKQKKRVSFDPFVGDAVNNHNTEGGEDKRHHI